MDEQGQMWHCNSNLNQNGVVMLATESVTLTNRTNPEAFKPTGYAKITNVMPEILCSMYKHIMVVLSTTFYCMVGKHQTSYANGLTVQHMKIPLMQHNLGTTLLQALQPARPASAQNSPASQCSYRGSSWVDLCG